MEYAKEVYQKLRDAKIRVELDERDEKIGYKIREAQQVGRVPYMLVIGAKEVEENNISVRNRDTNQTVTMSLDDFIAQVTKETVERI